MGRNLKNMLEDEITRLENILENGLPEDYGDFDEFLMDYLPHEFSWSPEEALEEFRCLLGSQAWMDLAEKVREKRGYDFAGTMNRAVEETIEFDNAMKNSKKR